MGNLQRNKKTVKQQKLNDNFLMSFIFINKIVILLRLKDKDKIFWEENEKNIKQELKKRW